MRQMFVDALVIMELFEVQKCADTPDVQLLMETSPR